MFGEVFRDAHDKYCRLVIIYVIDTTSQYY